MTTELIDSTPEPTAEAVRAARLAAGHSQAQAAAAVGLGTRQRWCEIESNRQAMDRARWALYLLATGQHPAATIKPGRKKAAAPA